MIIDDKELEQQPVYVYVNGSTVVIDKLSDCFDIVVGSDMLQISKVEDKYQVTNAMNGWGNNCKKDYENVEVKLLFEQPNNFLSKIKEEQGVDKWISVEDLPKNNDNVLVFANKTGEQIDVAFYNEEDKEWQGLNDFWIQHITHWKPLPSAPIKINPVVN